MTFTVRCNKVVILHNAQPKPSHCSEFPTMRVYRTFCAETNESGDNFHLINRVIIKGRA